MFWGLTGKKMYAKQYRLRLTWLINKVIKKGRAIHTPFFVCKTLISRIEHPQFCIMISAKVHKSAVKRNKVRRRIQEIIRIYMQEHAIQPINYVFMIKKRALDTHYSELKKIVIQCLK